MDAGKSNYGSNRQQGKAGLATESVTYVATKCRSKFSRGKFSQEIQGVILNVGNNDVITNNEISTRANSAETVDTLNARGYGAALVDIGRGTDPAVATKLVNTLSNSTDRFLNNTTIAGLVNSSNPLQAGINAVKNAASTAATNFLRPYENAVSDSLNNYAQTAGNWLKSSITSITTAKPRPAIPPETIVAAVGQTNEFGGLEAPPTLAVKPGENGVGGYSYETYNQEQQGFVVEDAGELPQQGIVDDDQGFA
jgi:hypothetical protein